MDEAVPAMLALLEAAAARVRPRRVARHRLGRRGGVLTHALAALSRRHFLQGLGQTSGAVAVHEAMRGLGFLADDPPPPGDQRTGAPRRPRRDPRRRTRRDGRGDRAGVARLPLRRARGAPARRRALLHRPRRHGQRGAGAGRPDRALRRRPLSQRRPGPHPAPSHGDARLVPRARRRHRAVPVRQRGGLGPRRRERPQDARPRAARRLPGPHLGAARQGGVARRARRAARSRGSRAADRVAAPPGRARRRPALHRHAAARLPGGAGTRRHAGRRSTIRWRSARCSPPASAPT